MPARDRQERARPAGRARHALGWAAALAACTALGLVAGCSSPSPLAPVTVSDARLVGRTVSWTTSQLALGSVRWGEHAGRYDHVSYPGAPAADRTPSTDHSVELLTVATNDSVYLQSLSRLPGGTLVTGPSQAFRVGAVPVTPALLTWSMIDVGFGDSHLLTMPATHERVLVDAGERRDADNVMRFLTSRSVTRLDAVLMTHAHEDHIGGMVGQSFAANDGVLERCDVGELVEGPPPSASRTAYDELVALCATRSIPRRRVDAGDRESTNPALAWDPGVHVAILHAGGGRALGGLSESEWLNDDSIVMRLSYGGVAFVMGGDAESPVESELLAERFTLDASVLKVHHHGSANASDPAYLDAVHPRVGLIPITSYESYGGTLPSTVVLQRLRDRAADIYASDRAEPLGVRYSGDAGQNVTVATDGASYEIAVEPSLSRHWAGLTADAAARGGTP